MAEQAKHGAYWDELRAAKEDLLPVRKAAKEDLLPVRKEVAKRRGRLSKVIVAGEHVLARPWLFGSLVLAHLGWVILNVGWIPGVQPWDPYPFTFLATIASVEAPFITLLVLMAQQREGRIAELREEMDLQLHLHDDRQMSEALVVLRALADHLKVPVDRDPARARAMEEPLHPQDLLEHVHERLEESEGKDPNEP